MKALAPLLRECEESIRQHWLQITDAQWQALLTRLETFTTRAVIGPANSTLLECYDEQIWTLLVAAGFAAGGEAGTAKLCRLLSANNSAPASPLWMEALPVPPRFGEGNTNLDIACGGISKRGMVGKESKQGIQYDGSFDHIVFCEMKWYSDISKNVSNDQCRNQLARVIENAITFQNASAYPARCTVTLVTPAAFKNPPIKSRLYHYKYEEYVSNRHSLLVEFEHCSRLMKLRNQKDWSYPGSIDDRLKCLELHWISFEELFEELPESELKAPINDFNQRYNKSEER